MTIIRTDKTKDKPIGWSAREDWIESQDLLEKFAKLTQPDVNTTRTNTCPRRYLAKK